MDIKPISVQIIFKCPGCNEVQVRLITSGSQRYVIYPTTDEDVYTEVQCAHCEDRHSVILNEGL